MVQRELENKQIEKDGMLPLRRNGIDGLKEKIQLRTGGALEDEMTAQ